jgi:Helix-turn-helix domain
VHPGNNPLHCARVRRGLNLSHLAASTLLSPRIVQKIDEGRFAELPGGLYARSYIRTFATAVGLDAEETVRELAEYLPVEEDPFTTMRNIARACDPPWVLAFESARTSAVTWLAARSAVMLGMTRFTIGAIADAIALLLILAILVQSTAWTCGVAVNVVLASASGPMAIVWGMFVLAYFTVLDGLGATARRVFVCRWAGPSDPAWPLQLPTILGRALFH